ncbi:M23 family metallopeptidase [Thiohalorhabdus sp.]|uniref:M23 family metallopeptidase n=1 Tax=Thiohalorhabdus sp. TaxID=3094134 RepID=UPI002FC36929
MRQALLAFALPLALLSALVSRPILAEEPRLSGDFRQGGLIIGEVEPGSRVYFGGQAVRVGTRGRFALGLGRQAPERVPLAWRRPDGTFHQREVEVTQRRYETQRINGLSENLIHPDDEALERIRQEQERVRQARAGFSALEAFRAKFIWPVKGPVTGIYGTRRILNGEPRQPHYGIDIAASAGTPVRAPAGGIVKLVEPNLYFSGGTLILDHGHGVSSSFLHLRRVQVQEGSQVSQGQVIASVGSTGRSTGPHLDWRINWFDKRLDPSLLAGPMPATESKQANRGG